MTTALFLLRATQMGIRISDLDILEHGQIIDMMIEASNDGYDYKQLATQADFDRF